MVDKYGSIVSDAYVFKACLINLEAMPENEVSQYSRESNCCFKASIYRKVFSFLRYSNFFLWFQLPLVFWVLHLLKKDWTDHVYLLASWGPCMLPQLPPAPQWSPQVSSSLRPECFHLGDSWNMLWFLLLTKRLILSTSE